MLRSVAMPNIRSAEKRMRADRKRRERNLDFSSELKTLSRKFQAVLGSKDSKNAQGLFRNFTKRLDQAATKGIIHKNTASRKKSRLARQLANLNRS